MFNFLLVAALVHQQESAYFVVENELQGTLSARIGAFDGSSPRGPSMYSTHDTLVSLTAAIWRLASIMIKCVFLTLNIIIVYSLVFDPQAQ